MKLFAYLLAALALAGCAQNSQPIVPGTLNSPSRSSVVPASKGPHYVMAIVLPEAKHANSSSKTIESAKALSAIGKRQYHEIIAVPQAAVCKYGASSGLTGCEIVSESSATLKKATFTLYTKTNAKGCAVAVATYTGAIVPNGPLSLKFRKIKKC